jgi:nucleoside-diphosphate kinase
MSRGPIVAYLRKRQCSRRFQNFNWATLTLLKLLKELSVKHTLLQENAVHGSDSDENAAIEGAFHFAGREQF